MTEEAPLLQYVDKLIKIDGNILLIGRIIINHDQSDDFVFIYRPAQIFADPFNGIHMFPWIIGTTDDFFSIPKNKVSSFSTPDSQFMKSYHEGFLVDKPIKTERIDPTTGEPITGYLH